jgi:glycosidase
LIALALGCRAVPLLAQAPVPATAVAPDTSWVTRSALYEVFVQDFSPSGDFRGVMDGLDRIQRAGADVLWLMPIHPIGVVNRKGLLGSPYAARDYRAINPAYGTAEDFRALVDAVHARGMKLILDWVPDHTAPDHPWVREHPDYYVKNERGEPSVPRDRDGKLTDWDDVVQLDYGNPALRRAMTDEMRYWLEEFGIDGFRVDVAGFIPYDFWAEALPALRAAVPRRLLFLAEWGDPGLLRTGYDLIYAWDAYSRLKAVWKGAPASTFVEAELADRQAMPPGGMRMRFTTNHDETAWDNPPVTIFGPGAGARAAFVAMVLLPGRPLVYNGQEVESPQKLRLFERDTIEWAQPDTLASRGFYRRVVELTRTAPALIRGDFAVIATSAPDDVIAFRRGGLIVLVNPRPRTVQVKVTGIEVNGARDLLSTHKQRGNRVTLPAYGAMVLQWSGK